jgi:hypothetical protein
VSGEVVLTAPISMGSVYAGVTVPLSVPLTTPLPEGTYVISVELVDELSGLAASIADTTVSLTSSSEAQSQLTLDGTVTLVPDATDPAYADVALTITNPADAMAGTEVLLDVSRDGEFVETFPLSQSFVIPQGETSLSQRYVPPTGWEPGTWSFVVRLNIVDTSTGTSTNVATLDTMPPVQVGEE